MTDDKLLLMIPGPTNVPDRVLQAIAEPSVYHRGEQFSSMLKESVEGLQKIIGTEEPVIVLTSSGTGAIEAAISNLVNPGERVLAFHTGKFGERMGDIAAMYGAEVHWWESKPGQAPDPAEIADWLSDNPVTAATFTFNETSTGVQQDLQAMSEVFTEAGVMSIVDAVSILGGAPVRMDEVGLDAVAAGSQKALMLPPGLAFVALSKPAQQKAAQSTNPHYYFDLTAAIEKLADGQTPYTPAVNLVAGLREAVRMMLQEGLEDVYLRHRCLGTACREGIARMGLEPLVDNPGLASSVVTAVKMPDGLDSSELVQRLRDNDRILISGGQGALKGKIFRIGHMGCCQIDDLCRTLSAVAARLADMGYEADAEDAANAASVAYERCREENDG